MRFRSALLLLLALSGTLRLAGQAVPGGETDDRAKKLWVAAQAAAGSGHVIRGAILTLSGKIRVSYAPDARGPVTMTFGGLDRFEYEDTRPGQDRYRIALNSTNSLLAQGDGPFEPVAEGADNAFRARWSWYAIMYLAALPRICSAEFTYVGLDTQERRRVDVIGINGPCTPRYKVSLDSASHRVVALEYQTIVGQGSTTPKTMEDLSPQSVRTFMSSADVRSSAQMNLPFSLLRSNEFSWEKIELETAAVAAR